MRYSKNVFSLVLLFIVLLTKTSGQGVSEHGKSSAEVADPDSVINWLKTGNNEFIHDQFNVHAIDSSLRIALSSGQHPKAVILTCSDSRVPPELVFNKGLGDLFVIRVAGNISDDAVLASIEYAVEHLHTSLVVVMGHQSCGAIGAAVADIQDPGNKIDNHVRILTDKIQQAINTVNLNEADFTQKALKSNIIFTVNSLQQSRPVLSEAVQDHQLKIVGAIYDLKTGEVEWLNN